jgi:hypothetical protein
MVSRVSRPYEPGQMLLMPAALQEWLPAAHLAYLISDLVDHRRRNTVVTECRGGTWSVPVKVLEAAARSRC